MSFLDNLWIQNNNKWLLACKNKAMMPGNLKAVLWTHYIHWLLIEVTALTLVGNYCSPKSLEKICFPKAEFKTLWKRANSSELLLPFHKQLETNFIRFFFFFPRGISPLTDCIQRKEKIDNLTTKLSFSPRTGVSANFCLFYFWQLLSACHVEVPHKGEKEITSCMWLAANLFPSIT